MLIWTRIMPNNSSEFVSTQIKLSPFSHERMWMDFWNIWTILKIFINLEKIFINLEKKIINQKSTFDFEKRSIEENLRWSFWEQGTEKNISHNYRIMKDWELILKVLIVCKIL